MAAELYNHNPQNGRSNEASGPFGNPKWDNSDRPEASAQVNHSGGGNPLPNQHQSDAEVASQPKEEVSKVAFAADPQGTAQADPAPNKPAGEE